MEKSKYYNYIEKMKKKTHRQTQIKTNRHNAGTSDQVHASTCGPEEKKPMFCINLCKLAIYTCAKRSQDNNYY